MAATTTSRKMRRRSREQIKAILEKALRTAFPHDTIDVSDGFEENIHVMVVSREFDNVKNRVRQDRLWNIIDSTELTPSEKLLISLVYPVSVADIK